jgi:hypothetical protein
MSLKGQKAPIGERGERATCLVPELLLDKLWTNVYQGVEVLQPQSHFANGVILLVDISGFTKLSGSYCAMGKGGIDQLQLAILPYMGQLVEAIYTHGEHPPASIPTTLSHHVTSVSITLRLCNPCNPLLALASPCFPLLPPCVSALPLTPYPSLPHCRSADPHTVTGGDIIKFAGDAIICFFSSDMYVYILNY